MADLKTIKNILTQMKPELVARFHVSSLGLFGSVLRDDFSHNSDVDIIVDFSEQIGVGFIDLADMIEKKINNRVDLVSKKGIKEKYYKAIEAQIVYV